MDEKKLKEDIERLTLLDKEAMKALLERRDLEGFFRSASEFARLRREMRSIQIDTSVIEVMDPEVREILRNMLSNERSFEVERRIEFVDSIMVPKGFASFEALTEDEIEQLGSKYFYSWFSHYEYIQSLYEIESLIVGISVPDELKRFVWEVRDCYAFQQYNAVYSLCRTMLEVAMRDIGERTDKIQRPKNDREFYREYPPRTLINITSKGRLRGKIHNLYDELSSLIHGYKTIKSTEARATLRKTLVIVQELYDSNLNST